MTELIEVIDDITKYGLQPLVEIENREKDLEENLVKIYVKHFQVQYDFDHNEYARFDTEHLPNVIKNVSKNFPTFGYYHTVLNCHELNKSMNIAAGDAVDDLSDIIFDLLEVKWRKENNSEQDALWFFEFIFQTHTQQHIINLLNFMKSKNS
ncbi:MAG: DUF5063 domain-containing protein [Saprospiraceae bacterium]